ncbi:hypothetical protein [Massilia sp. PWRC2]|uniref:hypothetical protein n=1 Tax=Massilia sp. PWRC2 TaxID=2804626 RepID=UPI003CF9F969
MSRHITPAVPLIRRRTAVLVGMAVLASAGAHAQDVSQMFNVSGFGTVGMVHNSVNTGDYVADVFQPNGAGYTNRSSFTVDSKLAMQVDAKITDQWSAVLQVVSRERVNSGYLPRVEWANIKYAITPELSVRVGRVAMATFMNSETRLVGYANPWVRPPIETYSLRSTTNSDGIDGAYRHTFGPVTNTTQVWYGKMEVASVSSTGAVSNGVRAEKIKGIADSAEMGALTLRAALTKIDFRLNGAAGTFIYSPANVYNLGATYDPGNWFVLGELTKSDFGTVQRAQKAGYVTGGYRFNKFTPYITYSKVDIDDGQINLALRAQHTVSGGLRWDFRKNFALKVQLDKVQLEPGSNGFFTNSKPGMAGSSAKILSGTIDFVF